MAAGITQPQSPAACQPWCSTGDGHPDTQRPGDRCCTTTLPGDELHDRDGQEIAQIYALHRPGHPSVVQVWTDGPIELTPDQARLWLHAGLAATDLADTTNH